MHVVARDRATARPAGDVARQRRELTAHVVVRHEREKGPHIGVGIGDGRRGESLRGCVHAYRTAGTSEGSARRADMRRNKPREGAAGPDDNAARAVRSARRSSHPSTRPEAAAPQPLATCSSSFGFSKNCSSSVEFLSAVVDAWLPWIVVVTASK